MGAPPGATPSSMETSDIGAMSPEDVAGMFGDTSEGQGEGDNQGSGTGAGAASDASTADMGGYGQIGEEE